MQNLARFRTHLCAVEEGPNTPFQWLRSERHKIRRPSNDDSAEMTELERRGLLEETLVIWGGLDQKLTGVRDARVIEDVS